MNKKMIIEGLMNIPQIKKESNNSVSLSDISATKNLSLSAFTYDVDSQKKVICDIINSSLSDSELNNVLLGIIETECYDENERHYAFHPEFIAPFSEILANYK